MHFKCLLVTSNLRQSNRSVLHQISNRVICRVLFSQDYLDRRKLRLWDFFRNIDKDGTMHVPVSEFRKAVQA